jgi:hypothetical protein
VCLHVRRHLSQIQVLKLWHFVFVSFLGCTVQSSESLVCFGEVEYLGLIDNASVNNLYTVQFRHDR